MTFAVVLQDSVEVLLAIGGLSGIGALASLRGQRKKLAAEVQKSAAETESIEAETDSRRTSRELSILAAYRGGFDHLTAQLNEANQKIDVLTDYIEVLVALLRAQGVTVPTMSTPGTTPVRPGKA